MRFCSFRTIRMKRWMIYKGASLCAGRDLQSEDLVVRRLALLDALADTVDDGGEMPAENSSPSSSSYASMSLSERRVLEHITAGQRWT